MNQMISIVIYKSAESLPQDWDRISTENIFLTRNYLIALDESAPLNMVCSYIGIFKNGRLAGKAISQFLDAGKLDSFGEGGRCFRKTLRNFIFKHYASHVLFIGNNMLTGNNSFATDGTVSHGEATTALSDAAFQIKSIFQKKSKVHMVVFKDFYTPQLSDFHADLFDQSYRFTAQPNMVFDVPADWNSFDDYINAIQKKYRDQYKRARKKSDAIIKKKLSGSDILSHQERIYELYSNVTRNAPFNTFFLAENHFYALKQHLGDKFHLYGYFTGENLVGFNTLIENGYTMETYFLGYDEQVQKENMLYLNMLYDMLAYSINHQFRRIIFARTALEIKSSIGAVPIEMFGFISHENRLINRYMERIFNFLEPQVEWQQRHPFKITGKQI